MPAFNFKLQFQLHVLRLFLLLRLKRSKKNLHRKDYVRKVNQFRPSRGEFSLISDIREVLSSLLELCSLQFTIFIISTVILNSIVRISECQKPVLMRFCSESIIASSTQELMHSRFLLLHAWLSLCGFWQPATVFIP